MRSLRLLTGAASLSVVVAAVVPAAAQTSSAAPTPTPASNATSLSLPKGPAQQALTLSVEAGGIRALVCGAAPCAKDTGTLVAVPEEVIPLLGRARLSSVVLGGGTVIGRVDVPFAGAREGASWVLLIGAPPAGKGTSPIVAWSGHTGVQKGEYGEERSTVVVVEPLPKGGQRVLVGERRADVTLCGRPTLVGARAIDPVTLELTRSASVQNLSDDERSKALKIPAERLDPSAPTAVSAVRLLRATTASSAVEKRFSTLTDGDLATSWSENKVGDGKGEFVTMASAEEVGISAIDLVVRPTTEVDDGAAPRSLFLATTDRVFAVVLPEDAARKPAGTHYAIKLPAEVHTACLAVVLNEAYAPADKPGVKVTLAEISAHTAFDGKPIPALAESLKGGGDHARGAAAMLARAGKAGVEATIKAYGHLDGPGKQLAVGVIDEGSCIDQAPFFATTFAEALLRPNNAVGEDPELIHARDRVRRCGRESAPALAKLVAEGKPRARIAAADELATIAPGEAVPVLVAALATEDPRVRRDLRAALARAAKSPRARAALVTELDPAKTASRPEAVTIDLLRAVGPSLGQVEGAGDALAKLWVPGAGFRTRYLLLAPVADLARSGDTRAIEWLRTTLTGEADAHARGRAVEVAGRVPQVEGEIVRAIDDSDVRVRQAAIKALADAVTGETPPPGLTEALLRRLATDSWTFVRTAAAKSLQFLPADPTLDQALAGALTDPSPEVRAQVIDALAAHQAVAYADVIRDLQGETEFTEVRAHAILALGTLCDRRSVDAWTLLARGAKAPRNELERRLGTAALAALGQVHPADIQARLAPVLAKDAPAVLREMAKAALTAPGTCR